MSSILLGIEGASKPTNLNLVLSHFYTTCEGCVTKLRYPINKQSLLLASHLAKLKIYVNPIIILLVPILVLTIQPTFKTKASWKVIHNMAHMRIAAAAKGH